MRKVFTRLSVYNVGQFAYWSAVIVVFAWAAWLRFRLPLDLLARSAPVVQQSAYIRRPLGILAATYLQLLLIALVLSAAILLREKHRRRLGWLAALVVFMYSYGAVNCLEVAVVHSLENPRYMTVQMFFIILAQFLTILLILEVLLGSQDLIGRKPRKSTH
jgi:hypothetical protein